MRASPLADVLDLVLQGYVYVILASVVLSWISVPRNNPFVRTINWLVDPPLRAIRSIAPFVVLANIDLSPIILLLLVQYGGRYLSHALRF